MSTFEENVKQLETIVAQLERGDLPLEDSIKLFEDGMRLSSACKEQLETAEGKVRILTRGRDGSLAPEPFPREAGPGTGPGNGTGNGPADR